MRKLKGHIPFGYRKEDKQLIPIEEELRVLDEIKELVSTKVISLREGSSWIEYKTGRKLSYQGLKNIIDNERLGN
tara:strand:+ start:454 stop:678 length:225 start_codon:yes stop_codon:yes gene_type:complete